MDKPADSPIEQASNTDIIKLLKNQNILLQYILNELKKTNQVDEETVSHRVRVTNFNMSIGAMIGFIFKWIIASIPVAIVIGLFYLIIFVVILGSAFHLR